MDWWAGSGVGLGLLLREGRSSLRRPWLPWSELGERESKDG